MNDTKRIQFDATRRAIIFAGHEPMACENYYAADAATAQQMNDEQLREINSANVAH